MHKFNFISFTTFFYFYYLEFAIFQEIYETNFYVLFIWFLFLLTQSQREAVPYWTCCEAGEETHSGLAGNAAPKIKLIVRNKEAPAWP